MGDSALGTGDTAKGFHAEAGLRLHGEVSVMQEEVYSSTVRTRPRHRRPGGPSSGGCHHALICSDSLQKLLDLARGEA